jgi:uncharacterized protein YjbI with pentapeptide repeats
MSSLWDVSILNRGAAWVDVQVTLEHPDAGPFPESPGFALQLLLVPAYGYDAAYQRQAKAPLGHEFGLDEYYDAELVSRRASDYIQSVCIYKAVNVPFVEKKVHAGIDKRVMAQGIKKQSPGWDAAWQDEWRAYWADSTRVPYALYRIEVRDPRWIEHLRPGQSFDTAAWCPSGPWVSKTRNRQLPTPADALQKPWLQDFPLSETPRKKREMDAPMIERLASMSAALTGPELASAISLHQQFLNANNRYGSWQLLSVSGLPMCIYQSSGDNQGQQLVLRLKQLRPDESLRGRDLARADLSGSICRGVDFQGANLSGSAAVDAFFDGASFARANLEGIDFSGSSLRGCSFVGANLREADFEHTDLTGADFTDATLTKARFPGAILDGVTRNGTVAPTPARTETAKPSTKKSTSSTKKSTSSTKKAASTTKKSTSATKEAASSTKKSTSATKKSTSATKKSTSATKKPTSATKKSTSATKKPTSRAKK